MQELSRVVNLITSSVASLIASNYFADWLQTQSPSDEDLVIFNNSFLYRSQTTVTTKSPKYLCLKIKHGRPDIQTLSVTEPGDINAYFKLFSSKSKNYPKLLSIEEALKRELQNIGELLFLLIGTLEEESAAVAMPNSDFSEVRLDPSIGPLAIIERDKKNDRAIVIKTLREPEMLWRHVERELGDTVDSEDLVSLQAQFYEAVKKLQDDSRIVLQIPTFAARHGRSLLDELIDALEEQFEAYTTALGDYETYRDPIYLRELMRIGYNFADDAIKLLQLIIGISDLKPVVFWCTIKEQFDLGFAFKDLPWMDPKKKPSLKMYRDIISGARNKAFHRLLSLNRSVEADLTGLSIRARKLTLFSKHDTSSRKKADGLDYEDRELVELLSQLTHTPEAPVPFEFWKKNARVIRALGNLLAATRKSLWLLREVTSR